MLCSLIGYLFFSHWRRNNIKQKKCRRITLEWPYHMGKEAMLPSYWTYLFELYVNVFHSSVCKDIYACVFSYVCILCVHACFTRKGLFCKIIMALKITCMIPQDLSLNLILYRVIPSIYIKYYKYKHKGNMYKILSTFSNPWMMWVAHFG